MLVLALIIFSQRSAIYHLVLGSDALDKTRQLHQGDVGRRPEEQLDEKTSPKLRAPCAAARLAGGHRAGLHDEAAVQGTYCRSQGLG